jgi:hypothetical protein
MRKAVLFTAYFWDAFTARQYALLKQHIGEDNLYVIIDETSGPLGPIPIKNLIRTSEHEINEKCGLPPLLPPCQQDKSALWWNLDYLTYRFFADHPEVDYCLTLDFDARINLDIAKLFNDITTAGYDFVALPVADNLEDWNWRKAHAPLYDIKELKAYLLCCMITSNRAAKHLAQRRHEMATGYKTGAIPFWPFCEAFIPVELARTGMKLGNIKDFGDTTRLGWHHVWSEDDKPNSEAPGFIHPVLDRKRYLNALLRRHIPAQDIFRPKSQLWNELRKYPFKSYARQLPRCAAKGAVEILRSVT